MATTKPAQPTKDTPKVPDTGGPTAPSSVGKKEPDDRKPADNRKGGYGAG
ncbi:hypothetical protein [Methylobacterium gnaphalii]|uniref:Uncharacterized protein n=1 Tax=Methylobacterium gnaphalii TaxID=1010610 RepID=A0A512JKS6_9HYPH|nr:hypothetical protein [Methylobacterium gnaphalii]GEP10513.1 hypothetical protein MGN01_23580 [Methylobacterium gnaphalii]GJD69260.1 hypothetical protein MMMDOFMJ_2188 [Methylobacterium gnaphalii]GLS47923.1 hypothetical protein GCM10007885_07670 [Methylobacterium gnaphalii]